MIIEFVYHAMQLDMGWILVFILGNLHWVFAFYALAHIFFQGQKTTKRFFILFLVPWFWESFTMATGMLLYTGAFFSIYYIGEIALMKFAEDDKKLGKKLVWVEELWFLIVLIMINFVLWS